jgi:hypothetical protein
MSIISSASSLNVVITGIVILVIFGRVNYLVIIVKKVEKEISLVRFRYGYHNLYYLGPQPHTI